MIELKTYAARTHHGPMLEVNEDDFEVDLVNKIFFVIDGLGGAGVGDKTTQKIKESLKIFYTKIFGDPDSTMPFYFSHKYLIEGNSLINAFHLAHKEIRDLNLGKELSKRGAASVLAAGLAENILTLVSTGNCYAVLYRKGRIEEVIIPDGPNLLYHDRPLTNAVSFPLSGIGLFDDLHLQTKEVRIFQDDILLFMTDGAYAKLSVDELKFIFDKKGSGLKDKINQIFELSNSRGNLDNQTALLLEF